MSEQTTPCCDVVCRGKATPGCAMQTPRTVEEVAQEWLVGYHGSIDATALLLAFRAGARWQAARMPSVEEVAQVLAMHDADRTTYDAYWVDGCDGCDWQPTSRDADGHQEHQRHQAELVVALWGGGERG